MYHMMMLGSKGILDPTYDTKVQIPGAGHIKKEMCDAVPDQKKKGVYYVKGYFSAAFTGAFEGIM